MSTLSIRILQKSNAAGQSEVTLALEGNLDNSTAASLEAKLTPTLDSKPAQLVFDLAGLKFVTSAGIRLFLTAMKRQKPHGGQVSFVELAAPLEERLVRNVTEFRLDQKRSKRDLDFSRQNLFDAEARWRMNTGSEPTVGERLLEGRAHLRVDNTDLPPAVVAKLVVEAWGLSRG